MLNIWIRPVHRERWKPNKNNSVVLNMYMVTKYINATPNTNFTVEETWSLFTEELLLGSYYEEVEGEFI